MKQFNLSTGKLGEEIAREFLKKKGFEILAQNYKTKYSEIDLVTKQGKELVFVEVRTKIGENFGSPEDSLDKKKLNKLQFNAKSYIWKNHCSGNFRVDAICLVLNNNLKVERLNHYESIV